MSVTYHKTRAERAADRRAKVLDLARIDTPQTKIAKVVGITQARVSQILADGAPRRHKRQHMLRLLRWERPPSYAA